ncbi:MAG: BamA/TamA family outer membrane protein [Casimicrobium sp.]
MRARLPAALLIGLCCAPIVHAAAYEVSFVAPEVPSALRATLARYADVSRFADQADVTNAEITRLVEIAPEQLRKLLETEGYFNADIRIETSGLQNGNSAQRKVTVTIAPGPRTRIASVAITPAGAITIEAGGATRIATIRSLWGLPVGAPFQDSEWSTSKSALLSGLWADRYPAARIADSAATIDAEANEAALKVDFDSGPEFKFGPITVTGLQRYPRSTVDNLATITVGQPYTQKALLDFQDRLRSSGLFRAAVVDIEPNPALADAVPVQVRLREQTLHRLLFGPGFSTENGPRVTAEHEYLRLFGLDWQSLTRLRWARDESSFSADFLSYPLPNNYRNLVSVSAGRTDVAGLVIDNQRLRVGRRQDTDRITRLYFVDVLRSAVRAPNNDLTGNAAVAGSEMVWRNVDDPVFPTQGFAISGQIGAGARFGSTENGKPFLRALGRATYFYPLGKQWLTQARLEVGQVFASTPAGIPQSLLFKAGGEVSVRGYGFQTLGIQGVNPTGTYVAGGRFLMTGSAEIAREIKPGIYGTVFVDVGDAADSARTWKANTSYGIGARWRSPVGPVSGYLAYAQQTKKVNFGVSVGVTF